MSNAVERDLGVTHESPQVILIYEQQPLWHTSHGEITEKSVQHAVEHSIERSNGN